jgi:hypothetical protein
MQILWDSHKATHPSACGGRNKISLVLHDLHPDVSRFAISLGSPSIKTVTSRIPTCEMKHHLAAAGICEPMSKFKSGLVPVQPNLPTRPKLLISAPFCFPSVNTALSLKPKMLPTVFIRLSVENRI